MRKVPPLNQKRVQAHSISRPSDLANLLRKIERILTTEDVTLKGLADAGGLDPSRDFTGIYLNGMPLAEQDIRGFNFSASDLRNTGVEHAKRDQTTIFDSAVFDGPSLDPSVIAFNKRLKEMRFRDVEAELTKAARSGRRKLDVISFTTAIRKAPNAVSATHWYEEMRKTGVAPNVFTFTALINKSESEERAARWHEEMRKAGVAPDAFIFSTLINKSESEERAARWYEEMRESDVMPDAFVFSTLIDKSKREERATYWYDEMKKASVAPNDVTFNTLISKSESEERATYWYEEMKEAGVATNVVTFTTLIDKSESGERAVYWYEEMKKADVAPNEVTRTVLAKKGVRF